MPELFWKFKNKYVPISELRTDELFICSKHALRRMQEYEEKRTRLLNLKRELEEKITKLQLEIDGIDKPYITFADRAEAIIDRINEKFDTTLTIETATVDVLTSIQKGTFIEQVNKSIV